MDSPHTNRTLGHELVEGFFGVFVGTLLQIGRSVLLLFQKLARALARRSLRSKSLVMGRSMERAGMGDELLLQKLRAIPSNNKSSASEREGILAQLGESGLEPGVPPMGLEEPYNAGHKAYKNARSAEEKHDRLAFAIWPHTSIGWCSLIGSYATTLFLVLLLLAYFAPQFAPGEMARWFEKEKPNDSTSNPNGSILTLQRPNVRVTIKKVTIGRQELKLGNDVKVPSGPTVLCVTVVIENLGSDLFRYQTWRAKNNSSNESSAKIVDDRGNSLGFIVITRDHAPEGGVNDASVPSGGSVEDILLFAPPDPGFKRLDLYLPGEQIGLANETLVMKVAEANVEMPDSPRTKPK